MWRQDGSFLIVRLTGVGLLSIAVARRLGAEVTAVGSARGREMAMRQGANRFIDRAAEDPSSAAKGPYDVIVDTPAQSRWRLWRSALKPGGTFVTTLPSGTLILDWAASLWSSTRVRMVAIKSRPEDLRTLADWIVAGLPVPLDATIPVREVPTALARLRQGNALGRIAVTLDDFATTPAVHDLSR